MPVALLALVEFKFAKLNDVKRPAKLDCPRRGPDRDRHGADGARDPAIDRLGLGQPRHAGLDRRRPDRPRRLRLLRAQDRGPADRRQRDDRQPPVRGRQHPHLPRLRSLAGGLLLRQRVLPGRRRPGTDPGRLLDPDDVLFLLRRLADRRWLDGQVRRQETGLPRFPAGHDRDDRLGRRALRTRPRRNRWPGCC